MATTVTVVPKIEKVLDEALSTVHLTLANLAANMKKNGVPQNDQVRQLVTLVDAVTKLSKEDRMRSKEFAEGLAQMDEEELDRLLEEAE